MQPTPDLEAGTWSIDWSDGGPLPATGVKQYFNTYDSETGKWKVYRDGPASLYKLQAFTQCAREDADFKQERLLSYALVERAREGKYDTWFYFWDPVIARRVEDKLKESGLNVCANYAASEEAQCWVHANWAPEVKAAQETPKKLPKKKKRRSRK